jgi:hypothetical protein
MPSPYLICFVSRVRSSFVRVCDCVSVCVCVSVAIQWITCCFVVCCAHFPCHIVRGRRIMVLALSCIVLHCPRCRHVAVCTSWRGMESPGPCPYQPLSAFGRRL